MEQRAFTLRSSRNGEVCVSIIPGHFVTKHSHVNYCVDMTRIKSEMRMAQTAARLFADDLRNTPVDTVITLERMKMVGSFLAQDLSLSGLNIGQDIAVLTPEVTNGLMILRDNFIPYVQNKHVVLLTASSSTGRTIASAVEGIRYFGGTPVGAATVFGASYPVIEGVPVYKMFGIEDLPDYNSSAVSDCPLCKQGVRIDALVNSYGYSKLN